VRKRVVVVVSLLPLLSLCLGAQEGGGGPLSFASPLSLPGCARGW